MIHHMGGHSNSTTKDLIVHDFLSHFMDISTCEFSQVLACSRSIAFNTKIVEKATTENQVRIAEENWV